MTEPYLLICLPHRDSPFLPYRLVEKVRDAGDGKIVVKGVGADAHEWPDPVPDGWFHFYDEFMYPGDLDRNDTLAMAAFQLGRGYCQDAIRYGRKAFDRDSEFLKYIRGVLRDRKVDVDKVTDAYLLRLVETTRYNGRD